MEPLTRSSARRFGLTGGIGSGKSTVAAMLASLGATVVDIDRVARALTAPGGAGMAPIMESFGPEMVAADGSLDRDRMRAVVFADSAAKARLESILHPLIGARAELEAAHADGGVVFFDVPLLAESKTWRSKVSRVIVVDCQETTQVERVSQRPGWSVDSARRVIAQQASRELRRSIADAVIHNDGIALETLRDRVAALWARWVDTAAGRSRGGGVS